MFVQYANSEGCCLDGQPGAYAMDVPR